MRKASRKMRAKNKEIMNDFRSLVKEKEAQLRISEEIIDQFSKRNIKLEKKLKIYSNIILENKIDFHSSYGGDDDDDDDDDDYDNMI